MAQPSVLGESGAALVESLSTTVLVSCSLDVCRRLVFSPEQVLLRVTHAPSGPEKELDALRGHQLMQVCSGSTSTDINSENTLAALLELLDASGQALQIDEIDLLFSNKRAEPSKQEMLRLKKNALRDPDALSTNLDDYTLLFHMKPVGFRKRYIKDLAQVPSGSCFYFQHSNWALSSLGSVLKLPANKIKELDLTDNSIGDVGPELSRFEQMVDLRLQGNGIRDIELHYLPRLRHLDLSFNRLQGLLELAGLPSLEVLDLCDNQIGSLDIKDDMGSSSGSSDGWESLAHSDLPELRVLLLANNVLAWDQLLFNTKIAVLSEKPSLETLDFRGNLMLFSPRLDDLPPLESYRKWILTHCTKLEMLDGTPVEESEHLYLLMNPFVGEPKAGDAETSDGDVTGESSLDPERMPVFGGSYQPRTTDLGILSNMLAETFVLPSDMAAEILDEVQRSLSSLLAVPPTVSINANSFSWLASPPIISPDSSSQLFGSHANLVAYVHAVSSFLDSGAIHVPIGGA